MRTKPATTKPATTERVAKARSKPSAAAGARADVPSPSSTVATSGPLSRATMLLRIMFPHERQLGPGKIELLERIDRTGSISAAAREMGMSYRRAWLLVDETSRLFKRPVVTRSTGGQHGGGATLTDFGRALIAAYHRIEARAKTAIREELAAFETDLDDV